MNISVNFSNPFVLIFLCGTVATFLINHFLEFIDFRARAKNGGRIPEILQKIPLASETFDTEKLKKISAYEDAKYFKWCVSSVFTTVLDLALVIFGFYPFVFNFICGITGFPSTVLSHEYDHLDGILHMDKGLEVIIMPKEERKKFRETYGYEIYAQEGNFEELVKGYDYDSNTKKLIKK